MNRFFSGKNKYETEKNKGEDDILCQYVREEEYMKRKKRGRYDSPEGEEEAIVPDNAERSKLLTLLLSSMVSDTKAGYNISFLNVISLHLVLPSFIWFSCIVILLLHLSTTQ